MTQTTATQHFTYTGSGQYFTVPSGVTRIDVKVWGAGGGGTWDTAHQVSTGCGGGGGGFSRGSIAVVPGQRLLIVVGEGGRANSSANTYGGGGAGNSADYPGGSGGGLSGVFTSTYTQGQALVIAGGGGGATGTRNAITGAGGGGGTSGSARGRITHDGGPGTRTAGGQAGTGGSVSGAPGAALHGGNSAQIAGRFTMGGGGGGGGYYGGGGGTSQPNSNDASQIPGAGGGGSGYLAPTVTGGTTISGQAAPGRYTGGSAAASSDRDYRPGVGVGGATRTNGGHGQVVLQWVKSPPPVARLDKWAGDGQQTVAGRAFPTQLRVRAITAGGQGRSVPVVFTVVSGQASFGGAATRTVTTDASGYVSAPVLTAGQTPGPVRVTATTGGVRADFYLTVNPPPVARLERVAGDGQQTTAGQGFPMQLVVRAVTAGGQGRSVPVVFTVVSGQASFGGAATRTVTTD
ncbi:hypothetical protein ACFC1T_26085, partial [Kitasatospora sp. NPDC056076]|uniref:hypothetical protein n=1 Tax=Kitasatospora sp. NPDC056076 TaxID=3345703 RepID=UPI0035DFBCC3